jgi:hypothetical protein
MDSRKTLQANAVQRSRWARNGLAALLGLLALSVLAAWTASARGPAAHAADGRAQSVADGTPAVVLPAVYIAPSPTPTDIPTEPVALENPSFEGDQNWETDSRGNQEPHGWAYHAYDTGERMPFEWKTQGGIQVQAWSDGVGENIHRPYWLLPPDEALGQPRGLIIEGDWTYKAFSDHLAFALKLSQVVTATPGRRLQVSGYILGETRCGGPLENDTFLASLQLGGQADTRTYAVMKDKYDVSNNLRAWNRFIVSETVPDSGQLEMRVIVQNNWPCEVNFFIDNFKAGLLP